MILKTLWKRISGREKKEIIQLAIEALEQEPADVKSTSFLAEDLRNAINDLSNSINGVQQYSATHNQIMGELQLNAMRAEVYRRQATYEQEIKNAQSKINIGGRYERERT